MKNIIRMTFLALALRLIWEVAKELRNIDSSPEAVARRARDKARMGYVQRGP